MGLECPTTPVHPTVVVGTKPNATVALPVDPVGPVGPASNKGTEIAPITIACEGWWSRASDVIVGGAALCTV